MNTLAIEPAAAERTSACAALLTELTRWAERGWLRRLDAALARFVADTCPAAPPSVLLATALLAHLEGRGHSCLLLDELLAAPDELLAWEPEASASLHAALAALPGGRGTPAGLTAWLADLSGCDLVLRPDLCPATSDDRGQPLVLVDQRLYLRRYWGYESRVAAQVLARSATAEPVDEVAARLWLDRLFDAPALAGAEASGTPVLEPAGSAMGDVESAPADACPASAIDSCSVDGVAASADPAEVSTEPDWQKVACAVALRGRISVITGGPGTGKTYTAARLLALLFAIAPQRHLLRVALAAPTGKAAARLKQSIDSALNGLQARVGSDLVLSELTKQVGAARTLHSLLGARPDTRRLRHGPAHPLDVDVLIVDEASMVHLEMMASLLDALPPTARVVLLGDKDQLASVEAGAVLGDLCRDADAGHYRADTRRYVAALTGQQIPACHADEQGPALAQQTVMLRKSQRFGGAIGQLAQAVNAGDGGSAQALFGGMSCGEPVDDLAAICGSTTPKPTTVSTTGRPDLAAPGPTTAAPAGSSTIAWFASATPADVLDLASPGRDRAEGGYRRYLELMRRRPREPLAQDGWVREVMRAFDRFRVLCAVREGEWGVSGLNRAIEQRLAADGLLTPRGEWYEGRPVIVTRNDYGLGVFNGDIGLTLRASPGDATLRAWFVDGEQVRSVSVSRMADVQTAFVMTVHKSQGSEFDHTVLVLPPQGGPVLSKELVYTGITRARSALTLVSARREALAEAVGSSTRRSSGLQVGLGAG
ncbi:MAG: exodeoxyribonuclease V subunit alpha [Burkholderiales bacterium]|nr:exodeoxyribonuclease V subunit alpha [Burkholderiales bacterium]